MNAVTARGAAEWRDWPAANSAPTLVIQHRTSATPSVGYGEAIAARMIEAGLMTVRGPEMIGLAQATGRWAP